MEASLTVAITRILTAAAKRKASIIHFTVGSFPVFRIDDDLVDIKDEEVVTKDFIDSLATGWLDDVQKKELVDRKELTIIKAIEKKFRIKVNFFFQKKSLAASLRLIADKIPPLINLGLPKSVLNLIDSKSGLIVVCGPYGSGRTTTVASIVNEINKTRKENIVTIEKPIEYILVSAGSLIEQREVGSDVNSFKEALDHCNQSDVDVVAIDSSQDDSIIPGVLEFANSGRLALMTMDTTSVVQTVEEILSLFPADDKERAATLLATNLLAVICQRLVPRRGGGLIVAAEVLIGLPAVRSLILSNRVKQLTTILQSSREEGMLSLDQSLAELVKSGEVSIDRAAEYAIDRGMFRTIAQKWEVRNKRLRNKKPAYAPHCRSELRRVNQKK